MMTDPIADMLTRIRNANRIERAVVDMPATRVKAAIAHVLREEGFIREYEVGRETKDEAHHSHFHPEADAKGPKAVLRLHLKYGPEGEKVIRHLERDSRPGLRIYRRHDQLRPVLDGLGIAIISTSHGVMSDRQARTKKLGGELVCTIW
jgi:small subunit ribosomal protein S8